MPWHLSRSDPRKVYDAYHNMICVCQNTDQAALIVKAVTALGPQGDAIKLREPVTVDRLSHPDVLISPPEAMPLDTFEPDECCGKHLQRALLSKLLKADTWCCPKCGTEWIAKANGPLRNREPVVAVSIFR